MGNCKGFNQGVFRERGYPLGKSIHVLISFVVIELQKIYSETLQGVGNASAMSADILTSPVPIFSFVSLHKPEK